MDKETKYGTENGQVIAGEDLEIRPQAGAIELTRIVTRCASVRRLTRRTWPR